MRPGTPRGAKRSRIPAGLIDEYLEEVFMTSHGNTKGGGEGRKALARSYAERAGVSVGTWYRQVNKHQMERAIPRQRKQRADAGSCYLTKEQVAAIERMRWECADPSTGQPLTMDLIVRKAVARGILEHEVPVSTLHRKARDYGLRVQPAFRRLETSRPNEIHHIDATGSRWFEVVDVLYDEDGQEEDYLVRVRHEPNQRHSKDWKNQGGLNLWAIQLVDDHSRVRYVEYVVGLGESAYLMLKTIEHAWRGDPEIPFMHMPFAVNMDHGVLRRRKEIPAFFDRLGIELMQRMPHQPHVGGKVERPFRVLKERFEQSFADRPGMEMPLADLQDQLRAFLKEENRRPHPVYQALNRAEMYARIVDDDSIRAVPDNLLSLPFRPEERRVTANGEIRFEGGYYKVDLRLAGRKVLVFKNLTGDLCMTDPLDGEGRFVELTEGMRVTPYFDSRREDRWAYRYKPRAFGHEQLTRMQERRRKRDAEGWPAGERIWNDDSNGKVAVLQPEREKPEIFSPHAEAKHQARDFRNAKEALLWASEVGLGRIMTATERSSLDTLLNETLSRATVAEWCSEVRRRANAG